MRYLFIIMFSYVLLAFASCTGNKVYDHYEHTSLSGWDKVDALFFYVPALKDSGRYATNLGLRVNDGYPFQSLTLIIEQTVYHKALNSNIKTQVFTDTLNCSLFDRKGTVKGQGITYYQYHFRISEMDLHQGDSLRISVRHNMKREIMPGIADVGINLTYNNGEQ